jgi:hypothetical protein
LRATRTESCGATPDLGGQITAVAIDGDDLAYASSSRKEKPRELRDAVRAPHDKSHLQSAKTNRRRRGSTIDDPATARTQAVRCSRTSLLFTAR